jgi:hypothetical protein
MGWGWDLVVLIKRRCPSRLHHAFFRGFFAKATATPAHFLLDKNKGKGKKEVKERRKRKRKRDARFLKHVREVETLLDTGYRCPFFLRIGVRALFEMGAIHACDATKETSSQFWPFRQKRMHDRVMDDRFFVLW